MSKVPVAGLTDISDPFYRYQRHSLKVNKLKNKTEIVNLDQVAKDIEREPWMLMEYFKKKFGISFVNKSGTLTTTKDVTQDSFEQCIREFIEYYVLCPVCFLPETDYKITSSTYTLSCRCCSHIEPIKGQKDKIANRALASILKHGSKK